MAVKSSVTVWMFTVEELKHVLELEPPCSAHGKIRVIRSIVSVLEELEKLSNIVCFFLSHKL